MYYNTILDQKWINMYNSLLETSLEKIPCFNKMYVFDAEKL